MNHRHKIHLLLGACLGATVVGQVVRRRPRDLPAIRARTALMGIFPAANQCSLNISYFEESNMFSLVITSKGRAICTQPLMEGDFIAKIVSHKDQSLLLVNYQKDWAIWTRSLCLISFSNDDYVDIKWMLVGPPQVGNHVDDIAWDKNAGFCLYRRLVPKLNAIDNTELGSLSEDWFAMKGAERKLDFSLLQKLGGGDYKPSSDDCTVFVPPRT